MHGPDDHVGQPHALLHDLTMPSQQPPEEGAHTVWTGSGKRGWEQQGHSPEVAWAVSGRPGLKRPAGEAGGAEVGQGCQHTAFPHDSSAFNLGPLLHAELHLDIPSLLASLGMAAT